MSAQRYVWDIVLDGNIWLVGDTEHASPIAALDTALTVLEHAGYLWQADIDAPGADLPEASHVCIAQVGAKRDLHWYWYGSSVLVAADSSYANIDL